MNILQNHKLTTTKPHKSHTVKLKTILMSTLLVISQNELRTNKRNFSYPQKKSAKCLRQKRNWVEWCRLSPAAWHIYRYQSKWQHSTKIVLTKKNKHCWKRNSCFHSYRIGNGSTPLKLERYKLHFRQIIYDLFQAF